MSFNTKLDQVKWCGHLLKVEFARYHLDDTIAIVLLDQHGEVFAKATTCYEGSGIDKENEVLIKNYSENVGILEALSKAGIISDTIRTIPLPHVEIQVCKLLKRPDVIPHK